MKALDERSTHFSTGNIFYRSQFYDSIFIARIHDYKIVTCSYFTAQLKS